MTSPSASRMRNRREFAARHPLVVRARIVAFALFGWLYLILAGALSVLAAIVLGFASVASIRGLLQGDRMLAGPAILTTVGLTLVLCAIFRRAQRPPAIPSGVIIRPADAPRLFDCLDRICRTLRVRPMQRVLLTEEFNAAVTTVPKLSGVAGKRTYLEIGLPLLHATGPEHFDAILAHEIGHLSGRLNRFAAWLYGWNLKWQSIAEFTDDISIAPFARWYCARLQEYSHVLLESIELEADRLACEAVGRKTRADSLAMTEIRARMLKHDFYPALNAAMTRDPRPPDDFHARLKDFLSAPVPENAAAGHLRQALAERPDPRSTHPTLLQRLRALGIVEERVVDEFGLLPAPPRTTAAEYFLGDRGEELVWLLSASWKHRVAPGWLNEYRDAVLRESLLHDLRRKDDRQGVAGAELWRMARLAEEFQGRREAFGLFLRYLEDSRDEPRANFAFGRILIEEQEESGIPYIEFAMEADPFLVADGCRIVCHFLYRAGRHREAAPYEERAAIAALRVADAIDERTDVAWSAPLLPHGLSRHTLAGLLARLNDVDELEEAWLARIDVRNFPDKPAFLMIARPSGGVALDADDCARLAEWIDMEDHCLVLARDTFATRVLAWRASRLNGGRLYRRGQPLSLSDTAA